MNQLKSWWHNTVPVYVSTSCLVKKDNVWDVLNAYARAGLKNVEFGSSHGYVDTLSPARFKEYGFSYICHHYFPPPQKPLIVNLASQDFDILTRSREQIKQSIDFCAALGIDLFSVHAGFRADPDDRLVFHGKKAASYENAMDTFIESIKDIGHYAARHKVRIAIENNVLAGNNMVGGQNPYLLLCKAGEFGELFKEITSANIGILLDLGHLNVTAKSLDFDKYEFIRLIKNRVFALHVHENNGQKDEHQELHKDSWCRQIIKDFSALPVVIESAGQSIIQIKRQIMLLEEA